MLETLQNIDSSIFLFFHSLFRSEFMDNIMWYVSDRWIWVPMYIAVCYWMSTRIGWRRAIVYALAIGVAVAFADQMCATFIRPVVERLRPSNIMNPLSDSVTIVNEYRGGAYGFPSCHAANTFAFAVFMSIICRQRAVLTWMFVWVGLNCLSRMYLGVHYPGDLIAGAFVGTGCAWFVWWLLNLVGYAKERIPDDHTRWRALPILVGLATLAVIVIVAIKTAK